MELYQIFNDFEKNFNKSVFIKRKCIHCNKFMKGIKNDFKSRNKCKKCYFKIEEDRKFKEFFN